MLTNLSKPRRPVQLDVVCLALCAVCLALCALPASNNLVKAAEEPAEKTTADLFIQAQEAAAREDYETAKKLLDRVVARKDAPNSAYYWRGRALFCLAKVKESVADFDRYVKADDAAESRQWERGIAMYYAGQFQRGADQFKLYQTYHANDVENSVWRFLCLARAKDVETARKTILPIRNDTRIPMMKIYDLYRGEAQPDDVLEAAEEGNDPTRIDGQRFYAELYVGLYYEATGDAKAALPLLKSAAESHRKTRTINRYMWAVADVHYRLLKAQSSEKKDARKDARKDAKKETSEKKDEKRDTSRQPGEPQVSWKRHTIDDASRGADGVRLGDVNGDGRMDIVTGWEEGGRIRVCVNPASDVRQPWPSVEVGQVKSPEDAVFVDLDNDGRLDVVSCCEGKTKSIYVHWAPEKWNDKGWTTGAFSATQSKQAWMYALPLEIDGQFGIDLVVGAKGGNAEVGWLQAPRDSRALDQWRYHALYKAGWIMSLESVDMDDDGDLDVLLSDRKGANRGVKWLENPAINVAASKAAIAAKPSSTGWEEHLIGGETDEVMFLTTTRLDPDGSLDGSLDIVCATRNKRILIFRRADDGKWQTHSLPNPFETPNGKSVACGDMDGDGDIDIVHACNNGGKRQFPGVVWLERDHKQSALDATAWTAHAMSGKEGVKFDLLELVDLDTDGDLDVITCEERDNLGVFWYENELVATQEPVGKKKIPTATADRAAPNDKAAADFIDAHVHKIRPLEIRTNLTWWDANTTGKDTAFAAKVEAQNELDAALGDVAAFEKLKALKARKIEAPLLRRQIDLLFLTYQGKQVDKRLLQRMTSQANEIEKQFNVFRASVNGVDKSDSEVRKILASSKDSTERQAAWTASKRVGDLVEQDLKQLVLLRNDSAKQLGYRDFHDMSLALNEQKQADVLSLFDELDELTREPFFAVKRDIDSRLAKMYDIPVDALRPWHYHDPFFQEPPNVYDTDLDAVFANTDVLRVCRDFYAGISLPIDDVLERSDLYEKPGKSPHAFCADIDRAGDVRVLANVVPNEYWMTTMMHELGHAVYSSKYIPASVPYVVRSDAHILTTEGVAMMFERFSGDAEWLQAMKVEVADAAAYNETARRMRRNKLLIFSRWCQVMFRFEMAMYADPSQDLNELWWDLVEKYQGISRPEGRDAADYASKIHVVSAPAYYHNYMMGELFACQLHEAIVRDVLKKQNPATVTYHTDPRVGQFLKTKVFGPGRTLHWNEMTRRATGKTLSASAFAAEFRE